MVTYYSKAWLEACKEKLNSSEKHRKKAAKLKGKFMFRVWDGPDKKDRLAVWEFQNGTCTKVEFDARPAPAKEFREMPFNGSEYVIRFSCPFSMMAMLNRGEMTPLKAFASPDYQVEGKKTQMFKMMAGLTSWNDHNAEIVCNYDFTRTDDAGNAI
jgi:hypothetical protein